MTEFRGYGLELCKYLADSDRVHLARYVKRDAVQPVILEIIDRLDKYFSWSGYNQILPGQWHLFSTWYDFTEGEESEYSDPVNLVCKKLDMLTVEIPTDNIIQQYINMYFADKIAEKALHCAAGNKSLDSVEELLEQFRADSVVLSRELAVEATSSVEGAFKAMKRTGLTWPLESLNRIIGPYNKHLIIVASRPDGGKTSFLANTARHVAPEHFKGTGKCVLWFNNEESIEAVQKRVIMSAINESEDEINLDPLGAMKRYQDAIDDRIVFVEDATTVSKIEKIISKHDPGLIIIDQLYKVHGRFNGKAELEAERFRQLCEWARGLGKHVAPCIVTNQLDGSAENVKHPSMDCLYGSKTGAQGEADVILMIGRTGLEPDKRFLYTPKNKLTGRVMSADVFIDKDRARFYDI